MRTLNEITYNILNVLRGSHSQNNETISPRQIAYTVDYYRALLVRRDSDRPGFRFQDLEQDLGVLAVSVLDPAEGQRIPQGDLGFVLRTARRIPQTVRLSGRPGLTSVTGADFRDEFPVVDPERARWTHYDTFTSGLSRSFVHDGYVFLHGSRGTKVIDRTAAGETPDTTYAHDIPETVRVQGIFERPAEAFEFKEGRRFDADRDPYPLPGDYEQRIVQSLLSGEFKVMVNVPNDDTGDLRPNA